MMPANDPKQSWLKTIPGDYGRPPKTTRDQGRPRETTGDHGRPRDTTVATHRFWPQKLKVRLKESNWRLRETTGDHRGRAQIWGLA